jgi:hypothetical protein
MASIPTNPPANPVPGAVYVDTVTNTPYVWVGNAWMRASGSTGYNSQITTGAAILPGRFAIPPQDLVNQVGSTEPINPAAGQIWVDQSQDPAPIKIWDGTQWVLIGDGTFTNTFVQSTPPAAKDVGDTFYETSTGTFYIWQGTSWVALNSNDYPAFATPPVVGPAGDSYFNTSTNKLFVSDGTSWMEVCMAPCAGGADTHSFFGSGAPSLTQRPDSSALVVGDQYVDTTADVLYYWDGSAWVLFATSSGGGDYSDWGDFPGGGSGGTLTLGQTSKTVYSTSATTINLPDYSTTPVGYTVRVWNTSASPVSINPAGADKIRGVNSSITWTPVPYVPITIWRQNWGAGWMIEGPGTY